MQSIKSLPLKLDAIDIAILKSLAEDGRKSLRQMAREINVSTPTVKVRYERLFNTGLIKSISPIFDTSKIDRATASKLDQNQLKTKASKINLGKPINVKISCEYCKGPIGDKPHVVKLPTSERYFCCTSCKALYKEKYKGRIEALSERAGKI